LKKKVTKIFVLETVIKYGKLLYSTKEISRLVLLRCSSVRRRPPLALLSMRSDALAIDNIMADLGSLA
jgi:hypothetical protein